MKLTKRQMTTETRDAIQSARTFGAEAYRNGIRRANDDGAVIVLVNSSQFDQEQRAAIFQAWLQGATKAMFAEASN